jgi:hypothetical protein
VTKAARFAPLVRAPLRGPLIAVVSTGIRRLLAEIHAGERSELARLTVFITSPQI